MNPFYGSIPGYNPNYPVDVGSCQTWLPPRRPRYEQYPEGYTGQPYQQYTGYPPDQQYKYTYSSQSGVGQQAMYPQGQQAYPYPNQSYTQPQQYNYTTGVSAAPTGLYDPASYYQQQPTQQTPIYYPATGVGQPTQQQSQQPVQQPTQQPTHQPTQPKRVDTRPEQTDSDMRLSFFQPESLPPIIRSNSFSQPLTTVLSTLDGFTAKPAPGPSKAEDLLFPADKASLPKPAEGDKEIKTSGTTSNALNVTSWERPDVYTKPHKPILTVQAQRGECQLSVSDISQGSLGDCWLISAFASVVGVNPQFLSRLLVEYDGKQGLFKTRLCVGGLWMDVVVDDRLPCDPKHKPVFCGCPDGALWAGLLEKAVAKALGGYQGLQEGLGSSALSMLTGGVPMEVETAEARENEKEANKLWDTYLVRTDISKKDGGCFIVASCNPELYSDCEDDEEYKAALSEVGLLPAHAYSIVTVRDVYSEFDCRSERLLCMRNPWAEGEWRGAWSDLDKDRWTPKMVEMLRAPIRDDTGKDDDGIFWMPYEDFLFYFPRICLAEVFPSSWDSLIINSFISNISGVEAEGNTRWSISLPNEANETEKVIMVTTPFNCDVSGDVISNKAKVGTTVVDDATNAKISRKYSNYSVVANFEVSKGKTYTLLPGVYKGASHPFNVTIRLLSSSKLNASRK